MKNEDLLKAIGDIDDNLIEAADGCRATDNVTEKVKTLSPKGRVSGFTWKRFAKTAVAIAAAFALCFAIGAPSMFRMGSSKSASTDSYYDNGMVGGADYDYKSYEVADSAAAAPQASYDMAEKEMAFAATESSEEAFIPYEPAQGDPLSSAQVRTEKLIYRADITVETTDFDKAKAELEALATELGGYIENSSVYNGSYYDDNIVKNGYFVMRIPCEMYKGFMNKVGEGWHVSNKNEYVENVTEAYYDVVERIETLKSKRNRLLELMNGASNMSDIIEIENSLFDAEAQIAQLENRQKNYDKQVSYSTVCINLEAVTQMGSTVGSEGFGSRLVRAFKNGITNFAEGLADLVVWASYNIIQIIVVLAVVFVIWKFHLIRKIIQWIKR